MLTFVSRLSGLVDRYLLFFFLSFYSLDIISRFISHQMWSPTLNDYELMMYLRAARWIVKLAGVLLVHVVVLQCHCQ